MLTRQGGILRPKVCPKPRQVRVFSFYAGVKATSEAHNLGQTGEIPVPATIFASRPNGLNYKTAAFALARGLDAD